MAIVKVALLGLGTVGSGVLTLLNKDKNKIAAVTHCSLVVTKALVRNPRKHERWAKQLKLVTNAAEILNDPEIKIVIEVMGGLHPAKEYIAQALANGKNVVTANKDLLAQAGPELSHLAIQHKVSLRYEASVAGGIPILNALSTGFVGDEITQVAGIVNGTTNFILTQMAERGQNFAAALKKAQALGFAEADPSNDVSGRDAAYKMIILSRFAFGTNLELNTFHYQGITQIQAFDVQEARHLGYVIKLIGLGQKIHDHLFVTVAPMLVKENSRLAQIKNEVNALSVRSLALGQSFFAGPGAGSLPTASSVLNDLAAELVNKPRPFNPYQHQLELASAAEVKAHFYLSFVLNKGQDRLLQFLFKNKIELIYGQQKEDHLVLLTALTSEQQIRNLQKAGQEEGFNLFAYRIL